MKRSKVILVNLIIVLLLIIIGSEIYYFIKDNNIKININNDKYLVDITTPYYENPLTYDINTIDNNTYYISIKGLKNKKIENKINEEIESIINNLKKDIDLDEYTLYTTDYLGFENTLSIEFILLNSKVDSYNDIYYHEGVVLDTLNVDLNTGNKLDINDIVNDVDKLKEKLYTIGEQYIYYTLGDTYNYCFDCNVDKDYSTVEDSILSIINSFKRGDYLFSFRDSSLNLYFKNVYIYDPLMEVENEDTINECIDKDCEYIKGEYENYYLLKQYKKEWNISIEYIDIIDNLIIYDKFSGKNIFDKERIKVDRKFSEYDIYSDLSLCEYSNCQYFKEIDNTIYDISVSSYEDNAKSYTTNILNELVKNNKPYNVYKVSCETEYLYPKEYYYFSCVNYNYELNKKDYTKYRYDIYLNSYKRFSTDEGGYNLIDNKEYSFMNDDYSMNYEYEIYNESDNLVKLQDILTDKIYDYIPYDFTQYKTKEELVSSMNLYFNTSYYIKDTLGLYFDLTKGEIYLKYNDNIFMLAKLSDNNYSDFYDTYDIIINDLFK